MATIKGSNAALTHSQMDANFNEVTQATTDIATLQTQLAALQAELDTNQQSAENITTGVIARINTAKTQAQGHLNTWQSFPAFNTGEAALDGLLTDLVAQFITELQATIADYNAQITLLSEDFTI